LGRRALANEAEILPLLAAKGFETAYPEKLSFAEQIALFGGAEAIVAVDGAALVKLFVVPAGAKIGVMAVAGLSTPHYHCVSHHRQHQFTYLHGRLFHDQAKPLDVQDLYLPRARMEQFLQAF
jgi:capsular polysaccharide biosynthesis protein